MVAGSHPHGLPRMTGAMTPSSSTPNEPDSSQFALVQQLRAQSVSRSSGQANADASVGVAPPAAQRTMFDTGNGNNLTITAFQPGTTPAPVAGVDPVLVPGSILDESDFADDYIDEDFNDDLDYDPHHIDAPPDFDGDERTCSLCLMAFVAHERVCRLPCRHMFHYDCWERYVLHHRATPHARPVPDCPNCRGSGRLVAIWRFIEAFDLATPAPSTPRPSDNAGTSAGAVPGTRGVTSLGPPPPFRGGRRRIV